MTANLYRTKSGAQVRLGARLGEGAEGTVHNVEGSPDLAAKIYKPGLGDGRAAKVVAMVEGRLHASSKFVAYPIDALFDPRSGTFSGFTMRKAGGHKEVHQLYSPVSRKSAFPNATYPSLVRAMSNVARAMAAVHASGCVIGDVNHSVVMVSPADVTVTLIDSDSFQYASGGKVFPCKVGTPDFTPPELQGQPFAGVTRTVNHDAFGLATLVFMTLFMGRFPFVGRLKGGGELPPIERLIAEFRFAYSSRAGAMNMEPPPNGPTLADLPLPVAEAFERAFGPLGVGPTGRPKATDWIALLDRAEADLVRCNQNPAHHHFRQAPSCPWCRMEGAFPGFVAFVPAVGPAFSGAAAVDLAQLIATARGVRDPGSAPDLMSLLPRQPDPEPSEDAKSAGRTRVVRKIVGLFGGLLGVALLAVPGGGPIFGLIVLVGCAVLAFGTPEAVREIAGTAATAQSTWNTLRASYEQVAGNGAFLKARQDAEVIIGQLQALPGEEAGRIAALEAKRQELQMKTHLERFKLASAKIAGVGEARKLTLRSYGIETAAEVDYRRIVSIHGFGPSTANNVVKWRRAAEAKFVFNPSVALDPQHAAAIRADVSKKRADLVGRLRQATTVLQRTAAEANAARTVSDSNIASALAAFRQGEADRKSLGLG